MAISLRCVNFVDMRYYKDHHTIVCHLHPLYSCRFCCQRKRLLHIRCFYSRFLSFFVAEPSRYHFALKGARPRVVKVFSLLLRFKFCPPTPNETIKWVRKCGADFRKSIRVLNSYFWTSEKHFHLKLLYKQLCKIRPFFRKKQYSNRPLALSFVVY